MPGELNLSELFRSAGGPAPTPIDLQSVIRRSRRRRLPLQIGAGSVLSLAVVGIGAAGFSGLGGLAQSASDSAATMESDGGPGTAGGAADSSTEGASGSSGGAATAPEGSQITRAPAEKLNLCGGTLADVAPSATGLVLTADFPDAASGATPVQGSVTMTNTGSARIAGYTAASPAVTLSRDGIVIWHSSGPMIALAAEIDLEPGASYVYPASFTPVVCGVEDDAAGELRADLPAAPAGQYQVSAAIDFIGSSPTELVTGPSSTITLR